MYIPSLHGPDPSGPTLCSPSLEDPSPQDPSPHDPSLDGPAGLTLPGSGTAVPSLEKMFLPLKAKLFRRGQKPSAARSYRDISLPAFRTSSMAVGAPALGIKSGQGLGWELPWVKGDPERETEQAERGRRARTQTQSAEKVPLKTELELTESEWDRSQES